MNTTLRNQVAHVTARAADMTTVSRMEVDHLASNLEQAETAWDFEATQRRALEEEVKKNGKVVTSQEENITALRTQLAEVSARYATDQEHARQNIIIAQQAYETL